MIEQENIDDKFTLDIVYSKAKLKYENTNYLNPIADGSQVFDGEFDIYEIMYLKHLVIKLQRYEVAATLRRVIKKYVEN